MRLCICVIVVAGFVFFSCGQGGKAPKDLLSREQMVPIVYALMLSDEYSLQKKVSDSSIVLPDFKAEKFQQVFNLYKTTRQSFVESFQYYEGRPDELKVIFDSVDAIASRRRYEKLRPVIQPSPQKTDTPRIIK